MLDNKHVIIHYMCALQKTLGLIIEINFFGIYVDTGKNKIHIYAISL